MLPGPHAGSQITLGNASARNKACTATGGVSYRSSPRSESGARPMPAILRFRAISRASEENAKAIRSEMSAVQPLPRLDRLSRRYGGSADRPRRSLKAAQPTAQAARGAPGPNLRRRFIPHEIAQPHPPLLDAKTP